MLKLVLFIIKAQPSFSSLFGGVYASVFLFYFLRQGLYIALALLELTQFVDQPGLELTGLHLSLPLVNEKRERKHK